MSASSRPLLRSPHLLLAVLICGLAAPWPAQAVPSFARQTGFACSSCHTVFPQLNALGRSFKLRGYTMAAHPSEYKQLQEAEYAPISIMFQSSHTSFKQALPDGTSSDTRLPQEVSFFYAGRISSHLGAFMQITYDGAEDHLGVDNVDIRWANQGKDKLQNLTYGLTLNNNPTVEDVWNSTPAWGYPFAESGSAPSPAASPIVEDALAQQVAGLGAYASWNNQLYGDVTLYRASQLGAPAPPDNSSENVVRGVAPYARATYNFAWGANEWTVGALGIKADIAPGGGAPLSGPTNSFRDLGLDSQFLRNQGKGIIELHGRWIQEHQTLNAAYASGDSANLRNDLTSTHLDATYLWDRRVSGTVGYFDLSGSRDTGLYAPGEVDGSRAGVPDSNGMIFEVDYYPWYNTRFSAQYKVFSKFNGASSNYDGFGRDASANDTLYLNVWLMF